MAESAEPGSDTPEQKMSWQERETMLALQRLANARANLASLEEQAGGGPDPLAKADPADVARVTEIHAEMDKLRPKTSSRFGGGSARDRMEELEMQQRLILDRLGFQSYDTFLEAAQRDTAPATEVDPTVLDFARREFEGAEQAFLEITALVLPPKEGGPDEETDDETDDELETLEVEKPAAS